MFDLLQFITNCMTEPWYFMTLQNIKQLSEFTGRYVKDKYIFDVILPVHSVT